MKNLLLALFAVLFTAGASAQNSFQIIRRVLPGGGGNAERILRIDDNNFVVAGKAGGQAAAYLVNRSGVVQKFLSVNLGTIRSEFTDVVAVSGGYVFAGDCDDCIPTAPGRQTILVRTPSDLSTFLVTHVPVPANTPADNKVFGWQKIRTDGNNLYVVSQLLRTVGKDTSTNLFIATLNQQLNIGSNRFYDRRKYDNLGDFEIRDNRIHLLTWGIRYFGINGDTTTLTVLDQAGNVADEDRFRMIGLALAPVNNGTEWIIGGNSTENLAQGPQATLLRVNANGEPNGPLVRFGGSKIDNVWDVQPVDNNQILVAATFDQQYPPANFLATNPNFLDYTKIGYPYTARIYRFNATNLQQVGTFSQVQNSVGSAIILRSVAPATTTGEFFTSVGYLQNTPLFYARIPFKFSALQPDGTTDEASAFSVYPNPIQAGELLNFNSNDGTNWESVELYDGLGRLIVRNNLVDNTAVAVPATTEPGLYWLTARSAEGEMVTTPVQVVR